MSIDWWTIGLQVINVIILIWLLAHFFWKPVASIIAERNERAKALLQEAQQKLQDAETQQAEIEKIRAGFAKEHETIVAASQKDAERIRSELLAKAQQDAIDLQQSAKVALEKEQRNAEHLWTDRSSRLAVDIARRLLSKFDDKALQAGFLHILVEKIQALPDDIRNSVQGETVKAIAASPLTPEQIKRSREQIGKAFGAKVPIEFDVDPDLVAGLELRSPHLAISNSWQSDLREILEELSRDKTV